jgi:hypothetical protein
MHAAKQAYPGASRNGTANSCAFHDLFHDGIFLR